MLAPEVADPASWVRWWPDLDLRVTRDRGVKGEQWAVRGALAGSMEIWLEPVGEGTVLHWFLRADPRSPLTPRRAAGSASAGCGTGSGTRSRSRTVAEGAERVT